MRYVKRRGDPGRQPFAPNDFCPRSGKLDILRMANALGVHGTLTELFLPTALMEKVEPAEWGIETKWIPA